jgi:hypothetical protein
MESAAWQGVLLRRLAAWALQAIIEMVYSPLLDSDAAPYEATIEFATAADWERDVRALFAALGAPHGGPAALKAPEEGSPAAEALDRVRTAYGAGADLARGPDALLALPGKVRDALGTRVQIAARSGSELRAAYGRFVDSSNAAGAASLWPLVARVVVAGPWEVLAHGLRLVDAPGLADDNSARDAAVHAHLRASHAVWLVADVKRAVNNATLKEMVPPALRRALDAAGALGALTLVATHADSFLRSELAENLRRDGLREDASDLGGPCAYPLPHPTPARADGGCGGAGGQRWCWRAARGSRSGLRQTGSAARQAASKVVAAAAAAAAAGRRPARRAARQSEAEAGAPRASSRRWRLL